MKEKYELLRQTHQDVINCQGQASLAATIRDCQLKSDPPIEPPLTGEGRDGACAPAPSCPHRLPAALTPCFPFIILSMLYI